MNQPVVCSVCGSDWFYEVTLQQYSNMYSASPGGDMNPISTTNHQIRICICGQPFKPNIGGVRSGRTGNTSVVGVMEAIEKALIGRAQVPGMIAQMSEDVVSKGNLAILLEPLIKRIEALESTTADAPTPKPATVAARKAAGKAAKAAEPAAEEQ